MSRVSKLASGVVLLYATSAQAVELPNWNIATICASENAAGQCQLFEFQAKHAILGGWGLLPDDYRNACLGEVKEPYVSYRSLSQCLELQVLHGRELRTIDTAATGTTVPSAIGSSSSETSTPATSGDADKIETLEQYIKRRESWGKGRESSLTPKNVRLAAGASIPLKSATTAAPAADATPPIVHPAEERPPLKITEVPQSIIEENLAALLAQRESWSGATASPISTATVGSLADYLAERDSWGKGPAEKAAQPLNANEPKLQQTAEVSQADISKALTDLLAERESWGTEPSPKVAATPKSELASAEEAEPDTLAGYLARRASWGPGNPVKPVKAPLAAGAVSPLPATATATASPASDSSEQSVLVHAAEKTPPAQMTEIPRADVDKALSELLSERESWGTAPGSAGQQVAARSAEADACETELRNTVGKGTILFRTNSAILDAESFSTLDELSQRAKNCRNTTIHVEGHTDDRGSESTNQKLSEQRAMAVLNYLVKGGVVSSRIEAIGFGESRPLVPNSSPENRAKNRRIEFSVR